MASLSIKRSRLSPLAWREARWGVLFTLPWILGLLVFQAYPVLATFYLSFTQYNIVQPPRWTGWENFQTMLTADPSFWTAVRNSAYYALISVPLGLFLALGLALILNLRVRGGGVYRTLFYLPSLVPPIASTIVFVLMFNPDYGLINRGLVAIGLPGVGWLDDPMWSKPALIILSLWGIGSAVLIFVAGLREIPETLLEAALVDGASPWQRFRDVTLPLLTPVILFNLVMGVIYSFQVFDQAFVVGGTNGEPLDSTLMYMIIIYRNAFRYFAMGYASALSLLLFLAVLLITLVIFRTARLWVFYEGDDR